MRKRFHSPYHSEKNYIFLIHVFSIAGIVDALYVSYLHFSNLLPFYTIGRYIDCGFVLRSPYSSPLGIPLAYLGLVHFLLIVFFFWKSLTSEEIKWKRFLFLQTALGVIAALYEFYLQFAIIKAVCGYVIIASFITFILYHLVRKQFKADHQQFRVYKKEMMKKYIFDRFSNSLKSSSSSHSRRRRK